TRHVGAGQALTIYVVATTERGTRAALEAAAHYGIGLTGRIVLLVPHVVPYACALEQPPVSTGFVGERFRRLVEGLAVDIEIRISLCRPHTASLAPFLPVQGIILIGGRRRSWWKTGAQRVASSLQRQGRVILFVDERASIQPDRSVTNR